MVPLQCPLEEMNLSAKKIFLRQKYLCLLIAAFTLIVVLYSTDTKRLAEKPNFTFSPGTQLDGTKSSRGIVYDTENND